MSLRPATLTFSVLLAATGAAQAAGHCEAIRDGIDARIRAAGVQRFRLDIVDAGTTAPGRNVGTCERGSRKIMYLAGDAAAAAPAASAASAPKPHRRGPDGVITECRDGTVVTGGECPKPKP